MITSPRGLDGGFKNPDHLQEAKVSPLATFLSVLFPTLTCLPPTILEIHVHCRLDSQNG